MLQAFQPPAFDGDAGGCDLRGTFSALMANSPEIQHSLSSLPVSDRSVANAVMLWDGKWSDDTLVGGRALLRGLLIKTLAAAPKACLNGINYGPVLFLVPDRDRTAVLAIGSGEWHWADLLAEDPAFDEILLLAASKTPDAP
ncbi:hypothetical protein [Asticcacaulis sp. W401b]|uniref:hypothetical protein n=1 Tax=Asticcacaulis sp. W401b TaxID=3388666 RepID=UPI00397071A3